MLSFQRLIEKYSVSFRLEHTAEIEEFDDLARFDDLGRPLLFEPITTDETGALIPFPARTIYQSGGRLTEADRTLYSLNHNIPLKSKITYKGMVYHVESKTPYEDYADFSQYTCKAVVGLD